MISVSKVSQADWFKYFKTLNANTTEENNELIIIGY
jgi:hypothetical protein